MQYSEAREIKKRTEQHLKALEGQLEHADRYADEISAVPAETHQESTVYTRNFNQS
jgi:hypothetical protein